ncbi:hypothetical protein ACI2K4_02180 [Micromonospora sp. NPDC050397]|uniref:hypothetical protein n=1 Tax=Micromonospora sp. NPDC050397 TaxID=3364279 RepID=UPI00384D5A84
MSTSSATPDRALISAVAVSGLLFGWLAFRIFDARDQLWHYGVDRTLAGAAAGWLAVVTALAYVVLAVLTARRFGQIRSVALALLVPAAICAAYTIMLGGANNGKVGFSSASLILFALLSMAAAGNATVRIISYARQ